MPTTFTAAEVAPSTVVDALVASGFRADRPSSQERTVLDTFDGRLHRAGLRLELHRVGAAFELVLWGEPAAPPARLVVASVPSWPSDLPAGPLRERLAGVTRERALLPLATITSRVHVLRRIDRRGKATAQVDVHDRIVVEGCAATPPAWGAEVRAVVGHPDDAELTCTRLAMMGLEQTGSDLASTVAAAVGLALSGRSSSPTIEMRPGDDALAACRRVLLNLAVSVEANLPGTIADVDTEFLHELRVAVRRTRSVLSEAKGIVPDLVRDRYRRIFAELGQLTGPPRDLDVYLLGWDQQVAPLGAGDAASLEPVRAELRARRAAAQVQLARSLGSRRTRADLDRWIAWLADPEVVPDVARPVGPFIAARIARAQKGLLRDGREITPTSEPERLHDLRKDAKRLRYLLECFGGLLDPKARKAFVAHLKALQENLGDHQDAEVQLAQLAQLARDLHGSPGIGADVLVAIGRLSDQVDRRRQEERAAFAERFAAYDSKANRRALDGLLAPLVEP